MVFCTQCGSPSLTGHRYCVVCGSPLSVPQGSPEATSSTSATSSWMPAPPLSGDENGEDSRKVLLGIPASPPTQSRLSVLFRAILSIPLLTWVILLSFAVAFCVVVAWFSALFTRRIPTGLREFVINVLRYGAEVQAYESALVGRWPGFSLHRGPHSQVSLQITEFPLNRAAVFFRNVLSIPAALVMFLVNLGTYVLTALAWITALVFGRVARPVYQARMLALRFSTRYSAYVYMLTPTQPFAGFFGDQDEPSSTTTPDPGVDPAPPPLTTRLHASKGGRVIFTLSLVAGVVMGGLYVAALPGMFGRILGRAVLSGANQQVLSAMDTFNLDFPHCIAARDVVCARTDATTAASVLSLQVSGLTTFEGLISHGHVSYLLYLHDVQKLQVDMMDITLATSSAQQSATYRQSLVADYSKLERQYLLSSAAL